MFLSCIIQKIMKNENYTDYQYNRCTSRGICSINPATASLQEVILLYLKHAAYYALKLNECGKKDKRTENLILNTMSVLGSNYEISEANFEMINSTFKTELPRIMKESQEACPDAGQAEEQLPEGMVCLSEYIKFGEKEFHKRLNSIKPEERNLYRLLFILVKSLCINILVYESFEREAEEEIVSVYRVLNLFNSSQLTKEELIRVTEEIAGKDCNLMNKISILREERYGEQNEKEVSFSTTKGKAVLVVGSNIRELEQVLDVFADKDIDVYTHDNMIIAHTFPEFNKYKNLKGQFGHGMENCLIDFSTFPGPIILTRYSLFNVENLYRGRLFTTDFSYSKGVIPIKNNDFSEVIKSAEESKGFKTGKPCIPEKVGFSFKKLKDVIKEKLDSGKYNNIIIFGIGGHSAEEKDYFRSFTKHLPSDVLVISLFCCDEIDNVVCVNASGDIYGMTRMVNEISANSDVKVTVFFPFLDRHTLSVVINAAVNDKVSVYLGNWNQTGINSNISEALKTEFGVNEITTSKNDMNNISNVK